VHMKLFVYASRCVHVDVFLLDGKNSRHQTVWESATFWKKFKTITFLNTHICLVFLPLLGCVTKTRLMFVYSVSVFSDCY